MADKPKAPVPAWAWAIVGAITAMLFVVPVMLIAVNDNNEETAASTTTSTITTTSKPPASVGCPPAAGAPTRIAFFDGPPPPCLEDGLSYVAVINTEDGVVRIALDQASAPVSVNSFVFLARYGFYNNGSGSAPIGSDGRQIRDYVLFSDVNDQPDAGFALDVSEEIPTTPNKAGDVLTVLIGPGAIGSQFFILTATDSETFPTDSPRLGTVIEGLDLVRSVASGVSGLRITSVTIESS
jgi:cyclophilin family peptidyl-prolyl cis-trans isomerase